MFLKKTAVIMLVIACALAAYGFRKATYMKAPLIMDVLKDRQAAESEVELIKMVIIDEAGNTQVRELISAIKADADGNLRYLIRFLSPADIKGVTLLTKEEADGGTDQYLYLPALGQARKITGNQKGSNFMGSDFTFDDLRKENPKEYQYYRLQDEEIEGHEVYVVMSAPAGVDISSRQDYSSRILYVDKEDYNIIKIEFYEQGKNEPIKTFRGYDYNSPEVDGTSQRPRRAAMNNHEKKTTSIMTVLKARLNKPLPEEWFTVEALESWSQEQDDIIYSLLNEPEESDDQQG